MHKNIFFPDATPKTYTGSCHCKAIRFRVTMPSLEEAPVGSCNCTSCTAWGLLNMNVWKDDLEIDGEDQLKDYQYGQKRMTHKFCPTCSTNMFVYHGYLPQVGDMTGWIGVNTRNIDGIDIDSLKLYKFNGREEL